MMEKVDKDTHHVERARVNKKGKHVGAYQRNSHSSTSEALVIVTLRPIINPVAVCSSKRCLFCGIRYLLAYGPNLSVHCGSRMDSLCVVKR